MNPAEPTTSRPLQRGLVFLACALLSSTAQSQPKRLPELPAAPVSEPNLSDALTVVVREFRFVGNTIFAEAELQRIVRGYIGIPINSGDLENARLALTQHYIRNGYINSGALLEDQPVENGVITFRIVEGKLAEIVPTGLRRLRERFVERRIARGAGDPLNVNRLQETLLILKDNPNIKKLNAELRPGIQRGESRLDLQIEERSPWRLGVQARNDRPPSVGAEVLEVLAAHQNLTGHSDRLDLRYGLLQRSSESVKGSGTDNLGAAYRIPIHPSETALELIYNRIDYAVIEEPFDELNIDSHSDTYSIGISQPLFKNSQNELSVSLLADRRHSETFLLGEPFSFSAGSVGGQTTVSALRFVQQFVHRTQAQVLALRSTFNWGLDLLDSTDDGTDRDGKFLSWIGQAQYVRRLGDTACQIMFSTGLQWTEDPLLSLEQFSLGGAHSIRGYRENELVRDMGFVSAIELRLPLLFTRTGAPWLQLAPFIDYGRGWNVAGSRTDQEELWSAGMGLLITPNDKLHAELYWGHRFREITDSDHADLQDLGLHFKLVLMAF